MRTNIQERQHVRVHCRVLAWPVRVPVTGDQLAFMQKLHGAHFSFVDCLSLIDIITKTQTFSLSIEIFMEAKRVRVNPNPTCRKQVERSCMLGILARMECTILTVFPAARRYTDFLVDKYFLRKHGNNDYYGQK